MSINIVHSSIDENGKAHSGSAGDQTGKEVCVRSWYNRPWDIMLRYPDSNIAKKAKEIAVKLANSNLVGYDQWQRNTLYQALKSNGWDVDKYIASGQKTESDCSSFVYAVYACLIPSMRSDSNAPVTSNMRSKYKAWGFTCYTDSKYTSSDAYLIEGDILVKEDAHTVMSAGRGSKATSTPTATKTVDELAKEVLQGVWGNGDARKKALTDAGYDYSAVQAKVNELLKGTSTTPTQTTTDTAETIWNFLLAWIGNKFGVAGLMGNLYAESALKSTNLQNSYEKSLGLSDAEYTAKVDSGAYTNFVHDSAGYGLAQWTYYSRKQKLLDFAISQKASIGNLNMQLNFLKKEITEGYGSMLNTLKNATSILQASNAVLTIYEGPANQGDSVKSARASYGQKYYDQYAGKTSAPVAEPSTPAVEPAKVTKVTASKYAQKFDKSLAGSYKTTANLNMRDGAGTSNKVLTVLKKGLTVKNYGYYNIINGVKWLYIQVTVNGVQYTGFSSSNYLQKV